MRFDQIECEESIRYFYEEFCGQRTFDERHNIMGLDLILSIILYPLSLLNPL